MQINTTRFLVTFLAGIFMLAISFTGIAQCLPDSISFNYTGDTQTFVVPACVTSITVRAWGGAGGGGGLDCQQGGLGGGGAYSSSIVSVSPKQTLKILVGGGGSPGGNDDKGVGAGAGSYGYGNGAEGGEPGYQNPGGVSGGGGGGGGGTAVLSGLTPMVVAGGGGGGGGGGCSYYGGGGGGGGQNGFAGIGGGGAAGASFNINGIIGSSGTWDCGGGGGGGGGYKGGDSGMVSQCDCGGGGGGGGNSLGGIILNGSGATPGYNIYPGLPAGDAIGGPADVDTTGAKGGNGYMIISYCIYADFTPSLSSTNVSCYGNNNGTATVSVSGGSTPYTYSWSPGGGSSNTVTGLAPGTYTIEVKDSSGCAATMSVTITQPNAVHITASSIPADSACAGQSVTLSAGGANNYAWSNGATTSSVSVIIPAGDTAYYGVKGLVGPCSDSIPLKIKIIPKITASFGATKDTVCPNVPVTIHATALGGQVTYKWSNGSSASSITVNDSVTTTYTATVYGLCDSSTNAITITVIPLPKPVIKGTLRKCYGAKDTLSVSSSINPTTYVWSNGLTSTYIVTGEIKGDSVFSVTAYNNLNCPVQTTFTVNMQTPPHIVIKSPTVSCSGSPVTLNAAVTGAAPYVYLWAPAGQTTDTATVNPDSTATYSITVTDSNGCSSIQKTTITPDNPTLSACCDKVILMGDDTVIVAEASHAKSYNWSPTVTCENPPLCNNVQVSPLITTTYTVTMTDSSGCEVERTVTIVVETHCFTFTIPNVFTPTNGGILGLDKVFYIKTEDVGTWELTIYDRWGKEMFHSTNPNLYWDGKTEGGENAAAGVYYYLINVTCQETSYTKDGFVQLIR